MFVDPVVEEVRQNGARISEECGGDVHFMAERLRRTQAEHRGRVIRRTERRPRAESPPPEPQS